MIVKKTYMITVLVILSFLLASCEKFLTRDPQDKQTNDTFWQNEVSLRTYAQDFYSNFFRGYDTDFRVFGKFSTGDDFVDDFITISGGYTVFPVSNIDGYNSYHAYGWDDMYGVIYKANVMLEKIPEMSIPETSRNHWLGVAYFFRAMAYSSLLKQYGGCPYFERVTDPSDTEELYKDRDSYLTVAGNVLADYQFAIKNMREDDTKLQVNKYVAGAYMSRDMLYHATWLKYHTDTGDENLKPLFQGAVDGALTVMAGPFSIGNAYNALFCTESLSGNPEVIFYREYASGIIMNSVILYGRGSHALGGATTDALESYLCSDGLPIFQSPLYKGGKYHDISKGAFDNRDPRLYETMVDSLRILGAIGKAWNDGSSPTGYCTRKFINDEWYEQNLDYVAVGGRSPADAPCMRYSEVLLNYAEARYEISKIGGDAFVQTDLDNSINKIRNRVLKRDGRSMPPLPKMVLAQGGAGIMAGDTVIDDPVRDRSVDPVLWEIRRERRVEMMQEGRRCEDLRRWGKYAYLNSEDAEGNPSKAFCGAYINLSYPEFADITGGIILFDPENPSDASAKKGYLMYDYRKGKRVFNDDKYYLKALPSSEIVKYMDKGYILTQNPGWE